MKRVFAAILFLLPVSAWAVPMTRCDDGIHYYVTADGASTCPPAVTFLVVEPQSDEVLVRGGTGTANGTVYVSIRSSCTPTRWRNVHEGSGDIARGNDADVSDGTFSVTVTGLSADTPYCAFVGQRSSTQKVSRPRIASFRTKEESVPPPEEEVAITGGDDWFYCNATGNDSNNGRTAATAKKTLPSSDNHMVPGDDMWLCTGSVWNGLQHKVTRQGSAQNINEIGCYYVASGVAYKCVDGQMGLATRDAKPVIRGGLTAACIQARTCNYPNATSQSKVDGVSSIYDGQFVITSTADYTTVSNIAIEYNRYYGLTMVGAGTEGSLHHVTIDGVDGRYTGHGGFIVGTNGVQDVIVRNSSGYYMGTCYMQKQGGGVPAGVDMYACVTGNPRWPGIFIQFSRSDRMRALVEYNEFARGWGEGISAFNSRNTHSIWRNNKVMNTWSDGIYLPETQDTVVENNIIVAGSGEMDLAGRNVGKMFKCIHMGVEVNTRPPSIRNVVRNNLCVGPKNGTHMDVININSPYTSVGAKIYGNTFIVADLRGHWMDLDSNNFAELDYKNNVLWTQEVTASNMCLQRTGASLGTYAYNHWYTTPSAAVCQNANDSSGVPGITVSNYATWQAYSTQDGESPTWPTFADAAPTIGGDIKNTGAVLTSTILDTSNFGSAWTNMTNQPSATEWVKALTLDATGAVRDGTPSKGAVE